MKIAFIIPPQTNNFMHLLAIELKCMRHDVLVNYCEKDCDFIIGMTHTQFGEIEYWTKMYPEIPLITFNWDWYDYIDKTKEGWDMFTEQMKRSVEVWTSSKAMADKCEKDTGIKSNHYMYAFITPEEFEGKKNDYEYLMQASREDKNKRFDWLYKACLELKIPFKAFHPGKNGREEYARAVMNCSVMVSSAREESIGGLTLMEASYCGKPILTGDHEGAKEVWGDDANYFKVDDYEDYKKQLKWIWENRNTKEVQDKVKRAKKRVEEKFFVKNMATLIDNRLQAL
jgi:hypothetical protein